jgi:VanZ family protein
MQSLTKAVCIAYLLFLTLLLWSDDPKRVIGMEENLPWILNLLMPYAHVLSFALLAVLTTSIRWPVPRWAVVLTMAAYGGLTEIGQGLTPHRTPAWINWLQDLVGIAVGTALCWAAALAAGGLAKPRRDRSRDSGTASSDEWEVLQEVLSRPVAGRQSWWG